MRYYLTIYLLFLLRLPSFAQEIIPLYNSYSLNELTMCKVNQLEAKPNIFVLLDKTIDLATKCSKYKNSELGFVIDIDIHSKDTVIFTIYNIIDLYKFNYRECSGIFYYNGYLIIVKGKLNKLGFKVLNQTKNIFYIKPDLLQK